MITVLDQKEKKVKRKGRGSVLRSEFKVMISIGCGVAWCGVVWYERVLPNGSSGTRKGSDPRIGLKSRGAGSGERKR